MASWQEIVRAEAENVGGTVTSGYRTPGEQERLGGPASSYHTKGTRYSPGAIDVGGTVEQLRELFRRIRQQFAGRINELYLNVPGGQSLAIKNDRYLGYNPEAGRPRHLHIAISGEGPPAARIPAENRGEKALAAAPADVCVRSLCPPDFKGMIARAMGKVPEPQTNCICWSDIWAYGLALSLIVGGGWMVFLSRGGGE